MDKFSGISLFDFFSFFIPGFLLELIVSTCFIIAGIHLPFNFSLFTGNEPLVVLSVSVLAYLLGHALHYFGSHAGWLGIDKLYKKRSGIELLQQDDFLLQALNSKAKSLYGFEMINEKGNLLKDALERFFTISFRLLEHKNHLQTSRYLQVQFKLFINIYVTAVSGAVISLFSILYVYFRMPSKEAAPYLFVFGLLLAIVASLAYSIASERRSLFIKAVWWEFYTYYYTANEKTSEL